MHFAIAVAVVAWALIYGLYRRIERGQASRAQTPDSKMTNAKPGAAPDGKPYLSQYITYGRNGYGEVAEVVFFNPKKRIERTIIAQDGRINDFPGFEHPALIADFLEEVTDAPYVRFRSSFEKNGDGYLFLWQIQPDGRYWADEDGFGFGKGLELVLYAPLNDEGRFTAKFRIYGYGATEYYGTDLEDAAAEKAGARAE